ncbi:MAG: RHS repeat-associated core domain-containing protein, partial [Verrucomicrobiota bacterium]
MSDSAGTAGFKDGSNAGDDYTYDANGNMTKDLNKGITSIEYNHLNKPTRIIKDSDNYLEFWYDGNGIKLQKKVYDNGVLTRTIDYVGEFIYETEGTGPRKLQLIQHEEGRIVPNESEGTYDYQYHITDHQGNVRFTFSTTPEHSTVTETFESGESNGFQDLHRFTNANANTTSGGDEVALLQAGETGAMIFLSMNKGDTVDLTVNANYESAPTGNTFLGTAYSALFTSFDNVYGSGIEGGVSASSGEFDDALSGIDMSGKGNSSTAPRAFLNYIFFDQEMNYVRAGFLQVTTAAQGIGVHQTISLNDIIADREGYILAYLSNENAAAVNVYFDDFVVYHSKTNVVYSSDYYPFGYQYNEYQRTASTDVRYRFQEQEHDKRTGLNVFKYRDQDPLTGRFLQIDPLASDYVHNSTYAFAENRVVDGIDLEGLEYVRSPIVRGF